MPKLPRTPPSVEALREIGPDIYAFSGGESLLRIYSRGGDYPCEWGSFRRFGPVNARFDHHPAPAQLHREHGIYYAALELTTCLAETFQDTRIISLSRRSPWLVMFAPTRTLNLLDLTGSWPTRVGASMKINTGPRSITRAWSRHFYMAFPEVDGLYYASSMHAHRPCVALYERAMASMPVAPQFRCALHDPVLLGDVKRSAAAIGYKVIP
ncbi:RES domain-containing protein [Lujinxingia sediminis]|uniref:RES domain-containing protein n=1 Tax=Lujinxingia sediminis TaxID=2480984 RepID=A0ABY0CMT6_9DELT|nr:RES family NAD+ phosphorylase [Lujinxingia sediminis]RVU40966.1 RES domain-containing protein [Lujinxingia sediminis]